MCLRDLERRWPVVDRRRRQPQLDFQLDRVPIERPNDATIFQGVLSDLQQRTQQVGNVDRIDEASRDRVEESSRILDRQRNHRKVEQSR